MTKVNKIIEIEYCDDCPFNGKCSAWKKLTRNQRVRLTIGNNIKPFILRECRLKDAPGIKDKAK